MKTCTYTTKSLCHFMAALLAGVLLLSSCRTVTSASDDSAPALIIKKNYGITTAPQEIYLPVQPATSPQYLLIENPHINSIEVELQRSSLVWKTGDHEHFQSRPIENRFFVFPLGTVAVPDTLRLVLNKAGENLSFVARVFREKELYHFVLVDNYMIGGILGFYGLAILLSLTLFVYNRTYKFFFFLSYVFFSVWWILNDAGVLFASWWPAATTWHQSSRGFFSSLTMGLFGLYLYQNPDALIGKGIKVVVKMMLLVLTAKWLTSFLAASGYFPSSFKYFSMQVNAVALILLFGGVFVYLLRHWLSFEKNKLEVLAILTYCAFVVMLALRELGFSWLVFEDLHQLEVLFFFPTQCLFMSAHLYRTTKAERLAVEADLRQLKLQQQRTFEETVAQVEASEKKRIAQDLHDEIGGIFVALKYQSLMLKQRVSEGVKSEDLDYFIQLANEGIRRQYRIINELQTTLEQPSGLLNSLRNQINLLSKSSSLKIDLHFEVDETFWPPFLKAQVYRIILELLTNTLKHAKANWVNITIKEDTLIHLLYSDNGIGFLPEIVARGNGLENIKQRIHAMKGQYNLESSSEGTHYSIKIPLSNV